MRDPATRGTVADMARSGAARNIDEELVSWDVLTETAGLLSFNAFNLWLVIWALMGAPVGPLVIIWSGLAALAVWAAWRLRKGAR
jgi:hypothetical protein